MAIINMTLISDMVDIMRDELKEIGYKTSSITDGHELMVFYFTIQYRLVAKRPRRVHEAKGFTIPASRKAGYEWLKSKFEKGESVLPHLSKSIKGLKYQDKLLFDWSIHHFHLGTTVKDDGFVDQHDAIVFAIVEEDDVYMLQIEEHGNWSDKDKLEIVLNNWPHLLERIDGTPSDDFSSEQIGELRACNVNVVVTLSDGHGYIGRGMGYTANGGSAGASLAAKYMCNDIVKLEEQIAKCLTRMPNSTMYNIKLIRYPHEICAEDIALGIKVKVFGFDSLKEKFC